MIGKSNIYCSASTLVLQNFRYALLFKISIPVLNIDELELNVGNRLSGVQMIGDLGAPGRA